MPPRWRHFCQSSIKSSLGNIVRADLTDFGDFFVSQQPEGELVQFRVMSQCHQEGATNFTITQFVVLQGGRGNAQQIGKLGTAQADRFTDLTDLLANSYDI